LAGKKIELLKAAVPRATRMALLAPEDPGFRLQVQEARTAAVALGIDLLVTDVGLPGMNGRQLADQARETRPDLKVLFITGYAESVAMADGFLQPGMEMITKPFDLDNLSRRIRGMVSG